MGSFLFILFYLVSFAELWDSVIIFYIEWDWDEMVVYLEIYFELGIFLSSIKSWSFRKIKLWYCLIDLIFEEL